MPSSILLALIEAALRLAIVSGRPMHNQNRFPCHDETKRSRSLKILAFTEPEAISLFYPTFCQSMAYSVTPY